MIIQQQSSPNPKPHPHPLFSGIIFPSFQMVSIVWISNHKSCYNIRYYNSCYLHNRKVVRIGLWTIIVRYYYNNNFPSLNLLMKLLIVFLSSFVWYIVFKIQKKVTLKKYKKIVKKTIQKTQNNDIILWNNQKNNNRRK